MESNLIGKNIIELNSIDSTNNYSVGLLKNKKIKEGTVIFARSQFSGKGYNGNIWESEANKNITLSIVLYPVFLKPTQQFYLNKITALAIYDFINNIVRNGRISIKWPNDTFIDKKKVAGVLIKNGIKGNDIEYSIVGIGVNLNQIEFRSNAPNPVSLKNITDDDYDVKNSIMSFCTYLEIRYLQLKNREFETIDKDYMNSLLYYESFQNYEYNGTVIEAKISDVNEFGKLVLHTKENETLVCDMKEIKFIFD